MNRIELIHRDFDTAVEALVKIADVKRALAQNLKEPTPQSDYEDGKFLESIGFTHTVKAVKAQDFHRVHNNVINAKNANVETSTNIDNVIKKYQAMFPFHKFILYSQVLNICEKYNLYLAPVSLYKGDIPAKNVAELKNFNFELYQKTPGCVPEINSDKPICAQHQNRSRSYNHTYIKLYICAPLNDFIKDKKILSVGKELYMDYEADKHSLPNIFNAHFQASLKPAPKDPIVLLPVMADGLKQIGFIVNTKWGLEASDPQLQVPTSN